MNQIDALDRFHTILEWLMNVQERHPEFLSFGLIHICFHDRAALGSAYGARDAAQMLGGLLDDLHRNFRRTDLVARDGTDFWVLVPYTSPTTVLEKIQRLVELASENGLSVVERDVAVFSLPDPQIIEKQGVSDSVEDFLAYLKANRNIAFHWATARPGQ